MSKNKVISTRLDMRSDFLVVGDNFDLVVLTRMAPVDWLPSRLQKKKKREFWFFSLTIALTIYRAANCAGAISASSKSMKMSFTRMLVTRWMGKMAVLLRNVLPSLCSATQSTFAVKDNLVI